MPDETPDGFRLWLSNTLRSLSQVLEQWAMRLEAEVAIAPPTFTETLPGDPRQDVVAQAWRLWLVCQVWLKRRLPAPLRYFVTIPAILTLVLMISLGTVFYLGDWSSESSPEVVQQPAPTQPPVALAPPVVAPPLPTPAQPPESPPATIPNARPHIAPPESESSKPAPVNVLPPQPAALPPPIDNPVTAQMRETFLPIVNRYSRSATLQLGNLQTDFRKGILRVELRGDWGRLQPRQQQQLATQLWRSAQTFNFTTFEVLNADQHVIARSPVIGSQIILVSEPN